MATSSLALSHEQWRAQVEAMKSALAELKLPQKTNGTSTTTDGVNWDEDDSDFGYSSSGGGNDVWDFISDNELDELGFGSGDLADGVDSSPYGLAWFEGKCSDLAFRKSGLEPAALRDQIMEILTSSRPEDELQGSLTDMIGFDDLDFVIELLSHRDEIVASFASQDQGPSEVRLLTRAQQEEALRQKDHEHKNAGLASARSKEAEYPHVYRAYNPGNTLSVTGKKYGLPPGTERLIFDKYEEYSIPAGKPGTLHPGRKLVEIAELDGLCQRTFKGYKALNRMQSLVYPVAYKTSENMLICAPTGAVSTHILYEERQEADMVPRVKRMLPC